MRARTVELVRLNVDLQAEVAERQRAEMIGLHVLDDLVAPESRDLVPAPGPRGSITVFPVRLPALR